MRSENTTGARMICVPSTTRDGLVNTPHSFIHSSNPLLNELKLVPIFYQVLSGLSGKNTVKRQRSSCLHGIRYFVLKGEN